MKRWSIYSALVFLVLVGAFPVYLLITGKGSFNLVYRHVTYEVMTDRGTRSAGSDLDTTVELTNFLHWRFNVTSDTPVQDRPFLDVAVDGTAYCNQIAVGLAHLLAKKGIRARLAMMRDKNGVGPHVVAEVLLDGRWILVDPLNGLIPGVEFGGLTISELSANFSFFEKLAVLRASDDFQGVAIDGSQQDNFVEWYRSFVVSPVGPSRPGISFVWGQRPKHRRLIRLTAIYYRVFGRVFSAFVQDVFLTRLPGEDPTRKKFVRARHYSLYGRWKKALPLYRNILANAKAVLREDALFFYGMALIESGDAGSALSPLDTLARDFPNGKWKGIIHFYRGEALAALGRTREAVEAYQAAPKDLLTPGLHRLTALKRRTKDR